MKHIVCYLFLLLGLTFTAVAQKSAYNIEGLSEEFLGTALTYGEDLETVKGKLKSIGAKEQGFEDNIYKVSDLKVFGNYDTKVAFFKFQKNKLVGVMLGIPTSLWPSGKYTTTPDALQKELITKLTTIFGQPTTSNKITKKKTFTEWATYKKNLAQVATPPTPLGLYLLFSSEEKYMFD